MANSFTTRSSAALPARTHILAAVGNGGSGRELAEAVLDGRIDAAEAMIAYDPRLLGTVTLGDRTQVDLLTLAVSRCDLDCMAMLLKAGMPVDGIAPGHALSLAILADTPEMAELLLRAGASPDPQTLLDGADAMGAAIAFGHSGGVMTLLRHGANPRWCDERGIDRARTAIDTEQFEIAEMLADRGASLWTLAEDGSTAADALLSEPIMFATPEARAARSRLIDRTQL